MDANVYKIPAGNLNNLKARIEKLARRAERIAKKGNLADATPIGLTVGERVVEDGTETTEDGTTRRVRNVYFLVTVTGSTPKLAGWMFVATLQHEEAGTILRSVPTASFPEGTLNRFRTATPTCEHCQYNRRRNDTFVVRHDDGTVKQVGRNCLAAFTGVRSPEDVAAMAELLAAAKEAADSCSSGGGGGESVEDTEEYLAYVACSVRYNGWVSRTKAREEGIGFATADRAWAGMPARKPRTQDALRPTDADLALAKAALAWTDDHLSAANPSDLNDYEHNLRISLTGAVVTHRLAGIVASAIGYYERAQGHILRTKMQESTKAIGNAAGYIGTPKAKLTAQVTLLAVFSFQTQYGVTHAHKFVTPEGNVLMWKTGTEKLELGQYKLTGTVKEHSEYKGELQTVMTRCKAVRTDAQVVAA
jgi:hypothetical protein